MRYDILFPSGHTLPRSTDGFRFWGWVSANQTYPIVSFFWPIPKILFFFPFGRPNRFKANGLFFLPFPLFFSQRADSSLFFSFLFSLLSLPPTNERPGRGRKHHVTYYLLTTLLGTSRTEYYGVLRGREGGTT